MTKRSIINIVTEEIDANGTLVYGGLNLYANQRGLAIQKDLLVAASNTISPYDLYNAGYAVNDLLKAGVFNRVTPFVTTTLEDAYAKRYDDSFDIPVSLVFDFLDTALPSILIVDDRGEILNRAPYVITGIRDILNESDDYLDYNPTYDEF